MDATRRRKWIDVPHEPGDRLFIRALTGAELREARGVRAAEASKRLTALLAAIPANAITAFLAETTADATASEIAETRARLLPDTAPADPSAPEQYDGLTVARFGVIGWTYKDEDGAEIPFRQGAGADLDGETFEWAVREIIAHSVRSLGEAPASAST